MSTQTPRKRLAFFDIDGTLVSGNTSGRMLDHPQIERRRIAMMAARTLPRYALHRLHRLEQADFRHHFVRGIASLLKGWPRAQIDALFDWLISELADAYQPAVIERLRQHAQRGDHVVLISTMFAGIAERMAAHVGADAGIGTKLGYRHNKCTGDIDGSSCSGARKIAFIDAYLRAQPFTVDLAGAYAYADSISDAPLLQAVGHPVATYPDAKLRALATARGWEILPAT